MASPSPTKAETSLLEGISDEEEEVAGLNSEHEEGEISSEGDDDNNGGGGEEGEISSPSLSSVCSTPRRANHRPPDQYSPQQLRRPVTSEVVIYDDLGRTAIYTSPHKSKSIVHSKLGYPRGPEGSKWANEREENSRRDRLINKREKEDVNNKRDRSNSGCSSNKCKEDDWERSKRPHKESKRKAESSKRTKGKESRGACASTCELPSHKAKRRCPPKCPRSKVITVSDTSSGSSHSCSSSSDDDDENTSPKTIRSKGKENKLSKDGDESLEYGPKRPPPKSIISRLPLYHKSAGKTKPTLKSPSKSTIKKPAQKISPQRYTPKSKMSYVPPQKYAPKPKHSYFSPKKYPPKSKGSYKPKSKTEEIKWETIRELALPLLKGQKHPPPGSIGEMLLKKKILETLRNQAKGGAALDQPAATNDNTAEAKTGVESKESSENLNSNTVQEGCTLDQEDEDELQLRLLALQSSLRFLSDIRKEGEGVLGMPSTNTVSMNILEGIKLPSDPQSSHVQLDNNSLPVNAERTISTTPQEYEDFLPFVMRDPCLDIMGSSPASPAIPSPDLRELYDDEELVVNGVLNSCKLIPLERDSKRSNNVNKETFGNDNPRFSDKEQQDSNQDPIDMDICDTSGEEDEGDSELLIADVGEDINLSNNNSPLHVQNPGYNNYSDQPSTGNDGSSLNPDGSKSSFQIPVEWAYMMPPPPPPEEPDNNMETMNSFSYDQALYLQTMQGPYENNTDPNIPYQQQFTKEEGVNEKWEQQEHHDPQLPQPINSQWSSTNTETYTEDIPGPLNNTGKYPTVPDDNMVETIPTISKEVCQETPEVLKDLKNSPAEQYQAFMLVMMNQQNAPLSKKSRNLIEVPLVKPDGSYEENKNLGQVVNKKSEGKRRRELRRQMRRLLENKKRVGGKNSLQKLPPSQEADCSTPGEPANLSSVEAIQDLPTHSVGSEVGAEEEDEDLLRAQLLIGMSLRKHQKEAMQDSSPVTKQGPIAGSSFMTHKPGAGNDRVPHNLRIATKNAPYSLPGSSKPRPVVKAPQVAKPLPLTKLHVSRTSLQKRRIIKKSRNDEGIQSLGFPSEGRTGLSDIGGFGLDPKSSQFYYQGSGDSSSLLESQKIKFPPIKPVIINLNSDSEEEGEPPTQIKLSVKPPVKPSIEPTTSQKESEPTPASSGLLSQSLDMLLKSLRNTKPTDMKGKKKVAQATNTPEAKPQHSDLTPQVVRHLSRPQQVEYRLLKEEIRKKEILRRTKMQQKKLPVAMAKGTLKSPIASTPGSIVNVENAAATITTAGTSSSETTQDRGKAPLLREVSWQEMGRLKIQLSNIASALDKQTAATASIIRKKIKGGRSPLPPQPDTMENSSLEGSPRNTPIYDVGSPRNISVYDEGSPRNTPVNDGSSRNTPINDDRSSRNTPINDGSSRNTPTYDDRSRNTPINDGSSRNTPTYDDRSSRNAPDYDDSPRNTPVDNEEDEDEETLRLMVLHTLNKNKSERKAVTVKERRVTIEDSPNAYESPVPETDDSIDLGTPPASLTVVIHQKTNDKKPAEQDSSVDYQQNTSTREVVISDKIETEGGSVQGQCPVPMDESFTGEWMVLDQVHDSEDSVEENNAETWKAMSEEEERLLEEGREECYALSNESKHKVLNTSLDKSTGGSDSSAEEVQERTFNSTNSALEPVNCEISVGERSDENDTDKSGECTKDTCVPNCTCVNVQNLSKNLAKPSGESQTVLASSENKCVQRSKTKRKVLPQIVQSNSSSVQLKKGIDNVINDSQLVNEKPAQKSCNNESDTEKKGLSKTIKKSTGTVSDTSKKNNSESKDKTDTETRKKLASEFSEKSDTETRKKFASESSEKSDVETRKKLALESSEKNNPKANKFGPASEGTTAVKNDDEQDKKLKLKNVERAYIAKRGEMNQVISQLDTLVQEATQEEEQRQGLRKTVGDLRATLANLEEQLEAKGVALKTKMEKIRGFHKQILTDRLAISKLQKRGEQLGCQVYGSKYILPKVLLSPHSKTKDTHVKQALVSSIDALRRVRDVNTTSVSPSASSTSTTVFPSTSSASLSVSSTSSAIRSSTSTSTTASPSSNTSASKVIRQLETDFTKEGSTSLTQAIRSNTSTKANVSLSTTLTKNKLQSTALSQKVATAIQSTALSKQLASTIQSIEKSSVALSQKVAKTVQAKNKLPNTLSQKVSVVSSAVGKASGSGSTVGKVSGSSSDVGKEIGNGNIVVGSKGVAVKRKSGAPDTRLVGVKAARTETSHTSVNHTQGIADNKEKGGSLDEMSELCPHDLLGRCNDDACIYQHLAQRRPDPLHQQPKQPLLNTNSSCVNLSPKVGVLGPRVSAVGTKPVVSKGVGMVKTVTVSETVGAKGTGITKDVNVTKGTGITKDANVTKGTGITKDINVTKGTGITKDTNVTKGTGITKDANVTKGTGITKATNVTRNVVGMEVVAKGVTQNANTVVKSVERCSGVITENSTSTTKNAGRGKGTKTLPGKTKGDTPAQGNLEAGIVAPGLDRETVQVGLAPVGQESFLSLQTDNFHNTDTVPSKDSSPVTSSPSPKIGNDLETVPPVTSVPLEDTIDISLRRESVKSQDKVSDVHSQSLDNITSDVEATFGHNENGSMVDVPRLASKGAEVLECTVIDERSDCNAQAISVSSQQDGHRLEEVCPNDNLETHLVNTVSERVPSINVVGMKIANKGVPVHIKTKENDNEPEEIDRMDKEENQNALNVAEKVTGDNDGAKRGTRMRRAVVVKIASSTGQVITTTKRSLSAEMGQKSKRKRVRRRRSASSVSDGERSGQAVDIGCLTSSIRTSTPSPTLTPTLSSTPIPTPTSTLSPTPTPTPSSTPIPTPTSTPSPTPTPTLSSTPISTPTSTLTSLISPTPTSAPTFARNLEAKADLAFSIDKVVSSDQVSLDKPIVSSDSDQESIDTPIVPKIGRRGLMKRQRFAREASASRGPVLKEIVCDDISIILPNPTSAPSSQPVTRKQRREDNERTKMVKEERNSALVVVNITGDDNDAFNVCPVPASTLSSVPTPSSSVPTPTSSVPSPASHVHTPTPTSTLPINQPVSSALGNLNAPAVKGKRKRKHKKKVWLGDVMSDDDNAFIVGPDPASTLLSAPSSDVPTPSSSAPITTPTSTLPSSAPTPTPALIPTPTPAPTPTPTPPPTPTSTRRLRTRQRGKKV